MPQALFQSHDYVLLFQGLSAIMIIMIARRLEKLSGVKSPSSIFIIISVVVSNKPLLWTNQVTYSTVDSDVKMWKKLDGMVVFNELQLVIIFNPTSFLWRLSKWQMVHGKCPSGIKMLLK